MAELKISNEFGYNSMLLTLEPGRKCACHCTWCGPQLKRRVQQAGRSQSLDDPGTFERLVEKAFGLEYDPTHFIQWTLRNKIPVVWATSVEPWQDVEQARSILAILRSCKIPVLFQTRGTNWREVWDDVLPIAHDASLYLSLPSLDPRYIKRFEPGSPPIEERKALVQAASSAGMSVMVSVAPYHPEWCLDLPALVREVHEWGATDIFLGVLHLGKRERESIETYGGDKAVIEFAKTAWTDRTVDEWHAARDVCIELGMGLDTINPDAIINGIDRVPSPDPWPYQTARRWPYIQDFYIEALAEAYDDAQSGPILLDWTEALKSMEDPWKVDQPFSTTGLADLKVIRDLPDTWKTTIGKSAPISAYMRGLWNMATPNGFPWMHPFVRYAVKSSGEPWRGKDGSLVMAYDPGWDGKQLPRTLDSLDGLSWLTFEPESDS